MDNCHTTIATPCTWFKLLHWEYFVRTFYCIHMKCIFLNDQLYANGLHRAMSSSVLTPPNIFQVTNKMHRTKLEGEKKKGGGGLSEIHPIYFCWTYNNETLYFGYSSCISHCWFLIIEVIERKISFMFLKFWLVVHSWSYYPQEGVQHVFLSLINTSNSSALFDFSHLYSLDLLTRVTVVAQNQATAVQLSGMLSFVSCFTHYYLYCHDMSINICCKYPNFPTS